MRMRMRMRMRMVSVRVIRMIVMIEVEVLQTKFAVHSSFLLRRSNENLRQIGQFLFFIFKTKIKKQRKFGAKPDDVKSGAKRNSLSENEVWQKYVVLIPSDHHHQRHQSQVHEENLK